MLLFPDKTDVNSENSGKQFYVVSPRPDVNEKLCAQFRLAGFSAVKGVHLPYTELDKLAISSDASGVVVDIETNVQVEAISQALQMKIPRQVWCGLAGDSDSISLSQRFARHDLHYFNINVQLEAITRAAVLGADIPEKRQAVSISVLGCKGGVGSTLIGYQLAEKIAGVKKTPTLYVQGANGSRDLDLHAGKKLTQDITPVHKYFDVMSSQSAEFPDLKQELLQGYNLALFEQAINTADKELLRHLIESSSCLVLVIDRSMVSIRVARSMIEILDLLQRSGQLSRRLYFCLCDTRPVLMSALSLEDIQSLLGRPVDVHFPYSKQGHPEVRAFSLFSRALSPVDRLAHCVLGSSARPTTSFTQRMLGRNGKRER